jgi:hypothetical protein
MKAQIQLSGMGSEVVMFELSQKTYAYWKAQEKQKLYDYLIDEEACEVPVDHKFAHLDGYQRPWWDLDTVAHYYGASPNSSEIEIFLNEGGKKTQVLDKKLKQGVAQIKARISTKKFELNKPKTMYTAAISSIERGFIFEKEFEFQKKSEFQKLVFQSISLPFGNLITDILFLGEPLIGLDGGDTIVKGYEVGLFRM